MLFFLSDQIGNPLLKLDRDGPATYEFFWGHGMISDELRLTILSHCDFEGYTFSSPHNASKACNDAMSEADNVTSEYVNNYDVLLDVCYPSIVEQELRLKKMVRNPFSSSFPLTKFFADMSNFLRGFRLLR